MSGVHDHPFAIMAQTADQQVGLRVSNAATSLDRIRKKPGNL